MRKVAGSKFKGSDLPVPLIRHKEPGLVQVRNRTAERASDVVVVEIGSGILRLPRRGSKIRLAVYILRRPSCQSRVFVVVKSGTVVARSSALGSYPDIPDARILGAEVVRENVDFTDSLQGRLTAGRCTKNATVGLLAVQREVGPVTLRTQELEGTVCIRLRDIRIQVEKAINVPAVPGQFNDCLIRDGVADSLVVHVDQRRLGRDINRLARRCDLELRIRGSDVSAMKNDARDLRSSHAGQRN